MRNKMRGVTLIELVVVVAIVALLATIAIPSYRQFVLRSHRAEAKSALLNLAAAQEKFYLQNNTYTDALDDAPPDGLGLHCDDRERLLHDCDRRRRCGQLYGNGDRSGGPGRRHGLRFVHDRSGRCTTATRTDCW